MSKTQPTRKQVMLLLPQRLGFHCMDRQWLDCAALRQRQGWQSIVAAPLGPLAVDYQRMGMRHQSLPPPDGSMFKRWQRNRKIAALLRANRPEQIWTQSLEDLSVLRRYGASCAGISYWSIDPPPVSAGPLLRAFASRQGRIVASSDFTAGILQKDSGLAASEIQILPPTIDTAQFNQNQIAPDRALRLAEEWRVPENAALILHVGALAPGGGQDLLLAALARMNRRDLYTVILGAETSPGTRHHLSVQIAQLGLLGQVLLVEDCRDLAAALWLAQAVLSVNDTPRGTLPELLAAQAMGRPVIVSDAGAHPELVQPGETAWMVPPGDADALGAMLNEVLGLSLQERLRLALRMQQALTVRPAYANWLDDMLDMRQDASMQKAVAA